ncbi:MAG TPA: ComEC/Rec2 family competence protein, partial [Symbiobacteriaceae bacterium]|nr:ComEC/Rec2 family competence protein [Symbiobacteriaceae bacterium]
ILQKGGSLAYNVAVEQVDGVSASGRLAVQQRSSETTPRFGERVQLTGRPQRPLGPKTPGGFDQAAYLARQGIDLTLKPTKVERLGPGQLSLFRRGAVAARLRLEATLRAALPARDAALLAGLLFGTRSDLPPDVKLAFQESGVVHLLAVSGGNVAMILLPFIWFLRRLGLRPRWAGAAGIPLVWFFVFLTGAGPSVMRAGLMATLVLLGDLLQRERNALNTLGAAAAILLLLEPGMLFDIGFQLSVSATLGIMLFARRIQGWLEPRAQAIWGERLGKGLAAGLSVTFAAQLVVEPISLFHFGALAPIAPIANLIVGLFLEPLVWLGTAVALVGLVLGPLAWLLGWPVRWGLWLLVFLVKATAAVPGGYLEPGRLPLVGVLLWYAVLTLLSAPTLRSWLWERGAGLVQGLVRSTGDSPEGSNPDRTDLDGHRGIPKRRTGRQLAALLSVALPLLLAGRLLWAGLPNDELRLTALDVGQGDALLLELPGGRAMLIDGGPAAAPEQGREGYDAGESVILPVLRERGIRRLDWVVLTHPHQDHAGGLPAVLRAMPVGLLIENGMDGSAPGPIELDAVAAERGVPAVAVQGGQVLDLGAGATALILAPPNPLFHDTRSDENANSVVLLISYKGARLLLTGDLEAVGEEWLLAQGIDLRSDLLKVAHHGSRYSSTTEFLAAVHPRYAVISAGRGNSFGHPDAGTVQRLQAVGATVYRTDQQGTISFRTGGAGWTVSTAHTAPPSEAVGLLGRPLVGAW